MLAHSINGAGVLVSLFQMEGNFNAPRRSISQLKLSEPSSQNQPGEGGSFFHLRFNRSSECFQGMKFKLAIMALFSLTK